MDRHDSDGHPIGDPAGVPSARPEGGPELLLLAHLLDMHRAMGQFRRVYGLESEAVDLSGLTPQEAASRLRHPSTAPAMRHQLQQASEEIKLHHAGLLEGYQASTYTGATEILDLLDPTRMAAEIQARTVRIGPLRLSSRFRPILMQAVWEEFLRRFRRLRKLEAPDFERYFREGFRQGYRRFAAGGRPPAAQKRAEDPRGS